MSAARRYTDAQVALFGVLGLVPWVRRSDRPGFPGDDAAAIETIVNAPAPPVIPASAPLTGPSTGPSTDPMTAPAAFPAARQAEPALAVNRVAAPRSDATTGTLAATPEPGGLSSLGEWLTEQPLAAFARRGEQRHETGPDQAALLVIAQAAPGEVSLLPLAADEAALLDLMLRAIGSVPGDWSTAALADPARDEVRGGSDGTPSVGELLEGRRALLWLVRSLGEEPSSEAHRFRVAGVPAYRVAHPALLLQEPQRKRQAWTVLKALRNHLANA